ncbi:MAG: Kae1-associated serine/threonine protein kinase [Candidatus Thermoplasmatota archaeon]|nr:Kae1-associated serine/threonine protein kinase [Candidatus Thermoplasmatota archaeon]MBU4256536.1 Kae1-associated serine/threonine protein kinase [Candidatus Thermoplasmatota archaeon]MCG2826093.1 Kae1-associated serine/threonine protein kinase [Thermoplasmatales archaeon]
MLLKRGAEAEIHLTEFLGREAIAKLRVPKTYRNKKIDEVLRKNRTKSEVRLMSEVKKYDVSTPIIYDVSVDECMIVMQYINGERVKDILNNVSEKKRKRICYMIGESVGKMHTNNIIHGDLTTSNMILLNDKIFFIDFGLGEKNSEIEAKGVDLHVMMEGFEGAHSEVDAFGYVLGAYKSYDKKDIVVKRMYEISRRGRYT